jgi:hypothetical protein
MNVSGIKGDDLGMMKFDPDTQRAYLEQDGVRQWASRAAFVGRIRSAREKAKTEALVNLARYKFSNFGYHAARWVTLNALIGDKQPNPFKALVEKAREMIYQPRSESRKKEGNE